MGIKERDTNDSAPYRESGPRRCAWFAPRPAHPAPPTLQPGTAHPLRSRACWVLAPFRSFTAALYARTRRTWSLRLPPACAAITLPRIWPSFDTKSRAFGLFLLSPSPIRTAQREVRASRSANLASLGQTVEGVEAPTLKRPGRSAGADFLQLSPFFCSFFLDKNEVARHFLNHHDKPNTSKDGAMYHDRESAINYLVDNYEFEIVLTGGGAKIETDGGIRSLTSMPPADLKALLEGGEETKKELFKRYYLEDWPDDKLIEKADILASA